LRAVTVGRKNLGEKLGAEAQLLIVGLPPNRVS
jgi:hypothetical protein